jgi:SAM-dependent methyltransferase
MNIEEYERLYRLEDRYWWFVARRELAVDLVRSHVPPGSRILDLGCGAGGTARDLAAWGRVVACDVSDVALGFARRRGLGDLALADAQALPFSSGSADCVVALDVLEHVPDDRAALAEVVRVLRPGGRLVLTAPAFRALWSGHDVALHHRRRYTKGSLGDLVREASLAPIKLSYCVFFLFPFIAATRLAGRFLPGRSRVGLWWQRGLPNSALLAMMRWENRLLRRIGFPWGVSVVVLAGK